MIAEWWTARNTPASPLARRLGYVDELVAIEARAARQAEAWAPHLARCRSFIEAGRAPEARGRAVLLGAGRLADLPVLDLLERYAALDLVDLVFTAATRAAAAQHPRLSLVERDISGVLATLPALSTPPAALAGCAGADLVCSINLASQLPIRPLAALARSDHSEEALQGWAGALIQAHLDALAALPCAVVLITDTEQRWIDPAGVPVEATDTLYGARLPSGAGPWTREEWTWSIAPRGEAHRRWRDERRVVALRRPARAASAGPSAARVSPDEPVGAP